MENVLSFFPKGVVLMCASTAPIPHGWSICDTTNGTPDFTGKYPIGTVNKAEIGEAIGRDSHTHSFAGVTDGANMGPMNGADPAFEHEGSGRRLHTHNYAGTTSAAGNYPPSTKIIFIMKI